MATPQEIEQQRLLNQQLMGNAQQATPGTISTGMEGMNVSPYMFGNQAASAPQVASAPANNTFNFGDNAPTGQGGIIDVTSPSRGVQVVPDTAPEMYNADRTFNSESKQLSGMQVNPFGGGSIVRPNENVTALEELRSVLPMGAFGALSFTEQKRVEGLQAANTNPLGLPNSQTASAAQAMKQQLGIPAPSDMSPNVPVGTGTVMQGSGPIAGQSVMQGIRDMDTQAAQPAQVAQVAQPAQMTQQILDPQGRLRRGSVDPQTGQVTLAPEYSGYEEAAAARQARAMQESTFMEPVSDSQRRGGELSDSEMRRYIKGKDPKASDREKAYSARIDMQRKDEATQTAAQQARDLAQMRIDASVESQEKTIAAQQEAAKVAQENAVKLARIRQQLTPTEARKAELEIQKLEQDAEAGKQVDPSDIQKILTAVGIPTLKDIKYDAQRDVFVDTAGINETFGPESAAYRILAGTKVGRTIMGGGPNMRVVSTRPSQG